METDLGPIKAALAKLNDVELYEVIDASNETPDIAPGLFGWLGAACEWELNHRSGLDYPLRPLEGAILFGKDAIGLDATMAVDAIVELLSGDH